MNQEFIEAIRPIREAAIIFRATGEEIITVTDPDSDLDEVEMMVIVVSCLEKMVTAFVTMGLLPQEDK